MACSIPQPKIKATITCPSASAQKLCTPMLNYRMSYEIQLVLNHRTSPSSIMLYKHALVQEKNIQWNKIDQRMAKDEFSTKIMYTKGKVVLC